MQVATKATTEEQKSEEKHRHRSKCRGAGK